MPLPTFATPSPSATDGGLCLISHNITPRRIQWREVIFLSLTAPSVYSRYYTRESDDGGPGRLRLCWLQSEPERTIEDSLPPCLLPLRRRDRRAAPAQIFFKQLDVHILSLCQRQLQAFQSNGSKYAGTAVTLLFTPGIWTDSCVSYYWEEQIWRGSERMFFRRRGEVWDVSQGTLLPAGTAFPAEYKAFCSYCKKSALPHPAQNHYYVRADGTPVFFALLPAAASHARYRPPILEFTAPLPDAESSKTDRAP